MARWLKGILIIIVIHCPGVFGQGVSPSRVYTPEEYGNFRQNWDITQDSNGHLFFGNSNGLIRFDGVEWRSIHTDGGIVRTLTVAGDKIHWAGNGNFGYIGTDSLHQFVTVNLRDQVESTYNGISNIWDSFEYNGDVYHRSFEALYKVSNSITEVIESEFRFLNVFSMFDQLIFNQFGQLLLFVDGDVQAEVPHSNLYINETVFVVLPFEDGYLLISRENGFVYYNGKEFLPFETEVAEYIHENLIYKGTWINSEEIALATLRGGIVIIDKRGRLKAKIIEDHGLPTNIIYDLFLDTENTLWASTDNGLVKLLVNHPFTLLNEQTGIEGAPLFIEEFFSRHYIGTTEGLFVVQNYGLPKRVSEIPGRTYGAIKFNNTFIIYTPEGLYRITNGRIDHLTTDRYTHLAIAKSGSEFFYGVRNNGLYALNVEEESIETKFLIDLEATERDIEVVNRDIWIAQNNRQVYRLKSENEYPVDIQEYHVPIGEEHQTYDLHQHVDRLYLTTDVGLFYFNEQTNSFIPDSSFGDPELNDTQVTRMEQCGNEVLWIRNNRKIKRARFQNGKWNVIENPYRMIGLNQGISDIHCDRDGSVWFAATSGIYHLTNPDWTYDYNFNTNITGVLIHNDSLIYGGYGDPAEIKELKFEENELRFTYAAASYIEPEANEYRTRLRGYEDDWSNWSGEPQKDYTFIPEGRYTFEVQGRNVYHKTGSIDSYTFTVLPPWYRTIWAYLGYLLILGGMVYAGHRIRINSILKEQRIRDGIARDLHDELSSTLSSISFFANAMDSPKTAKDDGNRFLSLIKKSSQEAKEKISDIVWVIHTENDDWENLLMRCKRFASDILDARDIEYNFKIKGRFTGKPDINQKKNIWLIFREIITNTARHAEPRVVEILFSYNTGKLHIHIEDNGNGFDPENTRHDGYGVQNIKERVQQMKGKCTLESMPDEGTRWVIDVPVG